MGNRIFFWGVKPVLNNGMEGVWSETFSFSIGEKRSIAETIIIDQEQMLMD
ncbi:MAG: hypothetical protein Ct9H300mP9_5530 [Candidatus Neomarinimicrobiota bacterium]|nr:MAG: hypothetical protein Ct9H300mP9_5530 [Candidatus Neomarinimicrobiota bacterium]